VRDAQDIGNTDIIAKKPIKVNDDYTTFKAVSASAGSHSSDNALSQ
jgi:hypothetical protein